MSTTSRTATYLDMAVSWDLLDEQVLLWLSMLCLTNPSGLPRTPIFNSTYLLAVGYYSQVRAVVLHELLFWTPRGIGS